MWDNLADKVVKALAIAGTHSPQDIWECIEAGEMQGWELDGSIIVTTINVYPQIKVCEIVMAAGNLDKLWQIHDQQIEPWAKEMGCKRLVGRGRTGWLKSAKEHGYGRELIMASKEI